MQNQGKRKYLFIAVGLIIILGFVSYLNSLNGRFIWDDEFLVQNNRNIKQWSKIGELFTGHIGDSCSSDYNSYRPLQMLTYSIDYSFWKLNVAGYHLTNILLHIFVALAIYWLIGILFRDQVLSLLASILFVVHPVHAEAIAYISGRAEPLAALFILLSINFYLTHIRSRNKYYYFFSNVFYVFALLSKESSLVLPLLLLLCCYISSNKLNCRYLLSVFVISLIYIILRMTVLKFLPSHFALTSFFQRVPGFFVAITEYLRILLLPFNLHMEYGRELFKFNDPRAILGIVITLILLFTCIKRKEKNKLLFFSICWFFLTLSPQSNLYPINAFMAEHWLYLPSLGFFLILARGLITLYRAKYLKNIALILAVCILVFYSYLTIKQNNYWKDPVIFYRATLGYAPDNPLLHYNLANIYYERGRNEEAAREYIEVIRLKPQNSDAYNNLCNSYVAIGKNRQAIEACTKALQLKPGMAMAYYNLGNAYYNIGNRDDEVKAYEKAIQIKPDFIEALNNLASAYMDSGKIQRAMELWEKIVQIEPGFAAAHFNLAVFYFQQKKYDLAIMHCDKVIELGKKVDHKFLDLISPYRK